MNTRVEAEKLIGAMAEEISLLRVLLTRALDEFADHQSWRCAHPDRYPLDDVDPPDCCCGLHQFTIQARAALSHEKRP